MSQRPITWLGVLAVAAMLAATAVATVAAVRHDRDEADAKRAQVANPAIRALAGDLATSAASIEDLRAYFEASDRVTEGDFDRFASSSLARQPALEYLAWTPREGTPLMARQPSAEGAAPTPLATAQERAAMLAARDTALPRMTAPIPQADGGRRVAMVAPVYAPRGAPGHRRPAAGRPARLRERRDGPGRPQRVGAGDPPGRARACRCATAARR